MSMGRSEIGGYFELSCGSGKFPHSDGILLNSGRNALRYILRAHGVCEVWIPYFTCPVVWEAAQDEGCKVFFYEIGQDWLPTENLPTDAYIVYNNYFGVNGQNVRTMAGRHPNLIVDNAQALYAPPCGLASFYSPRKFFGLPDGGIAICQRRVPLPEVRDESYNRMGHLLKRLDTGKASPWYPEFKAADASLGHAPVLRMSRLTEALMRNLDAEDAAQRRLENFKILHGYLSSPLAEHMAQDDVPMVYPLRVEHAAEIRAALASEKIYVAAYWPGMIGNQRLCDNVLALPIDQRYAEKEMLDIISAVDRWDAVARHSV